MLKVFQKPLKLDVPKVILEDERRYFFEYSEQFK